MILARRGAARCLTASVALAASMAALAGCGSGGASTTSTASPTAPTPAVSSGPEVSPAVTASVPPGTGPAPAPTATGSTSVSRPGAQWAAVLTAVRIAEQDHYDRVVLEFDRPFGSYVLAYVDAITEDPTGEPVQLRGNAFLSVTVQGATTDNGFQSGPDNPPAQYRGPLRFTPMLPAVQEAARSGDFEATLGFGLGLAGRTGYTASTLRNPDRLVIDIAHPAP